MKKIVIFGATGGIGQALVKFYKDEDIIKIGGHDLDFRSLDFKNNFENLTRYTKLIDEADIVINCAGVLGSTDEPYDTVFDVNFNSNWVIIRHFMNKPPQKKKKFVIIGSTSYKNGHEDYMLYSASKAAVFNLFQGAVKFFEGSNLILGLVNPRRVKTKMTSGFKGDFISAVECASRIFEFTNSLAKSKYVDFA